MGLTAFTIVIVLGAAVAAAGVLVAVLAFRPRARTVADVVAERLDAYEPPPPQLLNLDEVESQQRLDQRLLGPLAQWFTAAMARRTPDAARVELQRQLNLAGRPLGLSATEFLAVRYVAAVLGLLAGAVLGLVLGRTLYIPIMAAVGAGAGLVAPRYLLASRVTRARKELRTTLPDAMDLMSVCVEAGLTFEGAMAKVAERHLNTLGAEFAQVLREIRLGRSRRDAMAEFGERSGVDEVNSFAQAVVQSDALGTGISRILRIQSDDLRAKRRQRAQELGAKAGLKMLFPMVIFIFPSLWIVLLGPAVLLLMHQFGGS
ncbi:MAG: type II secretion system F family protein [Chloroflexi bacterium]|nr:MAG: type II secretion system F family protein [Chloroflexota bacterium]